MSEQIVKRTRKMRPRPNPVKEDVHGVVLPHYRRRIEKIAADNRWSISHTVEYLIEMGFARLDGVESHAPAHPVHRAAESNGTPAHAG